MLNIIHNSNLDVVSGSSKVINNLLKGLEIIKFPYVINKNINSTPLVYMPNGKPNLLAINKKTKSEIIIGPNMFDLPIGVEIPFYLKQKVMITTLHLLPSKWYVALYKELGYNLTPLNFWPVGIDTYSFLPVKRKNRELVLVYHKQRDPSELEKIKRILDDNNINYKIIYYGHYSEDELKEILKTTLFVIWHGCHETQGIAYQECLASNVPLLVYDVKKVYLHNEFYKIYKHIYEFASKINVTSVPYFSDKCGIIIEDISELNNAIIKMFDTITTYEPRYFILENLSLEKQAMKFIELYISKVNHDNNLYNYDKEFSLPWLFDFSNNMRKIIKKRIYNT